jgi:hypothetical protein
MKDKKEKKLKAQQKMKEGWKQFMEDVRVRGEKILDAGIFPPSPVDLIELVINNMLAEMSNEEEEKEAEENLLSNQNCSNGKHIN